MDESSKNNILHEFIEIVLRYSQGSSYLYNPTGFGFLLFGLILYGIQIVWFDQVKPESFLLAKFPNHYSSILLKSNSESFFIGLAIHISKSCYCWVVGKLLIRKKQPVCYGDNPFYFRAMHAICLVSLIAVLVPYGGIWLSWVMEIGLVAYLLKLSHNIKPVKTCLVSLGYHSLAAGLIFLLTSGAVIGRTVLDLVVLISFPIYSSLVLAINS